mgnify:CR=1 FL=1
MNIKEYVNNQLKAAGYPVKYEDVMKSEYIEGLHWTDYYCWREEEDYVKFHEIHRGKFQLQWELTHGLSWGWIEFIKNRIETEKKKNAKKKSDKKSVGKTTS